MEPLLLHPIGVIRSPHASLEGMPIQPRGAQGVGGRVELDPRYAEGLRDLDGFSHAILIYHFHASSGYNLTVKPFLDNQPHGVFATRAPRRPNPIGISVVAVKRVEDNTIYIENVDILDGTPLLDIKPYVPQFDAAAEVRLGWLEKTVDQSEAMRADERFRP